jgi:TPR repeat protein
MSRNTVLIGVAAVLTIIVVVFLFYPRPATPPVPPSGSEAPVTTEEERGDTAREVIEELEQAPGDPDYAEAYRRAGEFRGEGRLADAQLLYFFAARGGHGPAAFELATMHDPGHFTAETSLMGEPDPFQAYRWYMQARSAGVADAEERLAALRTWAEQAGQAGDREAEQLLLQWDSPR